MKIANNTPGPVNITYRKINIVMCKICLGDRKYTTIFTDPNEVQYLHTDIKIN